MAGLGPAIHLLRKKLLRRMKDHPKSGLPDFGRFRACTHKIAIGHCDLIKSALAHFADSIGHLLRSEKVPKRTYDRRQPGRSRRNASLLLRYRHIVGFFDDVRAKKVAQ